MNESSNRLSQIALQVPEMEYQHSLSSSQLICRKALVCLMPRPQTESTSLTIGQLGKRWSVAESRNRELIDTGWLAGVFLVPAAGRYRETVKIRNASIIAIQRDWFVVPATARPPESPPSIRAEHGRESDEIRRRFELVSFQPYLEMYAFQQSTKPCWTACGNQISCVVVWRETYD